MALTPLPPAPSSANPTTFATLADAFVAALGNMVTEINAQGSTPVGITPNFAANLSANLTLTSGVAAQVNFDTEVYDVGNIYDSVTNHQCNMTVSGKYSFNANLTINATTSLSKVELYIEGSGGAKLFGQVASASGTTWEINVGGMIQSGGSATARVFVVVTGTGTLTVSNSNSSFSGYFVAP